jgi:hypothetical protein
MELTRTGEPGSEVMRASLSSQTARPKGRPQHERLADWSRTTKQASKSSTDQVGGSVGASSAALNKKLFWREGESGYATRTRLSPYAFL